jgi:glycosyltransferase involved in cell wall biosynthesis
MRNEEHIPYSIVVPFFNEQESIPPLYMKITEVMDALGEPYELVFVDDGSLDDTYKILLEIYNHDQRVNLVRRQDAWLTRRLPSRVANWAMAKLSGMNLHDFGTTFKAYRREVLREIHLYGDLHRFIPALASWSGAKIAEVPIKNVHRKSGKSNYGLGRTTRVLLDLLSVKFLLDYSTKPLQFFGLFGLLGMGAGLLINLFLLYDKVALRQDIMVLHGPLLLLGIALIVSGIQFLSMGLLGEMLARTYYETQNKPIYAVREVKSRRRGLPDAAEPSRPSGITGG